MVFCTLYSALIPLAIHHTHKHYQDSLFPWQQTITVKHHTSSLHKSGTKQIPLMIQLWIFSTYTIVFMWIFTWWSLLIMSSGKASCIIYINGDGESQVLFSTGSEAFYRPELVPGSSMFIYTSCQVWEHSASVWNLSVVPLVNSLSLFQPQSALWSMASVAFIQRCYHQHALHSWRSHGNEQYST